MSTTSQKIRRGFTLIELSIAMSMGMLISAMVLSLFNLQLAFLKRYQEQNFLADEAPVVSLYVGKILSKADRFRLYGSLADAQADRNPRTSASPVVALFFRQLDGTPRKSILSFEDRGGGNALYYYVVPPAPGVLGEPQWAITKRPSKVEFWMERGVLRMALEGPLDPKIPAYIPERITYSGTMQQ